MATKAFGGGTSAVGKAAGLMKGVQAEVPAIPTGPPPGAEVYWWNPSSSSWGRTAEGKDAAQFWEDPKTGKVWTTAAAGKLGTGPVSEAGGAALSGFKQGKYELSQPKAKAAQDVLMWRQRQAGAGTVGYQTMGRTGGT